jgi:hypothetical protein
VHRHVSAWTTTLHEAGYRAGVYFQQDSRLCDLSAAYDSTTCARPERGMNGPLDGTPRYADWPTAPNGHVGGLAAPSSTSATTTRPGAESRSGDVRHRAVRQPAASGMDGPLAGVRPLHTLPELSWPDSGN